MKPILFTICLAWLLSWQAQAQCLSGDCINGRGHMRYPDGSEYTGHFKDGQAHGIGECIYADSPHYRYKRYKGDWAYNQYNGYGVATTPNGQVLRGNWKDNEYLGEPTAPAPPSLAQAPAINPRKYVLIIGVSQYLHYPSLKLADNDAYHFESFVRSLPGGALRDEEVILLIDSEANYQNIRKALHDLARKALHPDDMLLVFYSGHGLPEGWLAYDSYGEPNDIIAYDEINNILAQSKARHKLYLADACYSGSALKGIKQGSTALQLNGSSQLTMITSSKADETSSEDLKLANGVFTHYLLKGLEDGEADADGDRIVTDYELILYLRNTVPAATKQQQTPQAYIPQGRTEQIILSTLE